MTTDPFSHSANALPAAATWIAALLTGSLATSVAVMAVGATGLAMLSGRVSLRDGARAVIGCFVLFGAGALSAGILGLVRAGAGETVHAPPAQTVQPPAPMTTQPAFDPYAGASVPN